MSNKRRYYNWKATLSRQTGEQGEICIVIGAKNIGKTFGIRKQCVEDWIRRKDRFCEICRTKSERDDIVHGYFDKLQNAGYFKDYSFKIESGVGYACKQRYDDDGNPEKPKAQDWEVISYFVALTQFQQEKKRTYVGVKRFIFDEAIIDRKDRYHRYLKNEFMIFANLLDSISRQQPNGEQYRVYILGNACDLTAPYMRYLGINKVPEFGYSFWKDKHVLLHYVEPWDKEDMQTQTLVGRLLQGTEESEMVYGNEFDIGDTGTIASKTSRAKYLYGIKYGAFLFGFWLDHKEAVMYVSTKVPKGNPNVMTIAKEDSTLDYQAIERSSDYLRSLNKLFYLGALRYESPVVRDTFLTILDFMGVR